MGNLSRSINQDIFYLRGLNKKGIDDALIQPYFGHESMETLEIYSKLSINDAQKEYNNNMERFQYKLATNVNINEILTVAAKTLRVNTGPLDVMDFNKEEKEEYEDHLKWLRMKDSALRKKGKDSFDEGHVLRYVR